MGKKRTPKEIFDEIWRRRYSDKTKKAYISDATQLFKHMGLTFSMDKLPALVKRVTADDVANWLEELESKHAESTVARKIASVRTMLKLCVNVGWLAVNPVDGPRFSVSVERQSTRKGPTHEEVRRLQHYMNMQTVRGKSMTEIRDATIIFFLTLTGARVSDVVNITIGDWRERTRKTSGAAVVMVTRKGRKGKRRKPITIPPPACSWIRAYLENAPCQVNAAPIFRLTKAEKSRRKEGHLPYVGITDDQIRRMVSRVTRRCGFTTTPHGFRHYVATRLLDQGATIDQVKDFLGHERVDTTKLYDDAIREVDAWRLLAGRGGPKGTRGVG